MNKETTELMFSSKSDDWATPQDLFDKLNAQYGPFDLDVCAAMGNEKCDTFFTKEGLFYVDRDEYKNYPYQQLTQNDSLASNWFLVGSSCWMNPPYGRGIGKWIKKAYEESLKGCLVVCLLPARTDTKWFHEYCTKGEITFVKGRLKFGGHQNAAPFPSMIVVFKA